MSKLDENCIYVDTSGIITTPGTVYTSITASTNWYYILGEYVEVKSMPYNSELMVIMISTINVLGKPYYDSLVKNGVSFPKEIKDYLQYKFKILERDEKINKIIK